MIPTAMRDPNTTYNAEWWQSMMNNLEAITLRVQEQIQETMDIVQRTYITEATAAALAEHGLPPRNSSTS